MKIWLLTSGSYSEYRVNAVFGDRALADRVAARSDQFEVEEFDVWVTEPQPRILYNASTYRRDGWAIKTWQYLVWPWDDSWSKKRLDVMSHRDGDWIEAHGFDQKAVMKAMVDRITRFRAQDEGI